MWPLPLQRSAAVDSQTAKKNQSSTADLRSNDNNDSRGGTWGHASWRAKWANRMVAGLHGIFSSVWAIMVLRALSVEAMAAGSASQSASSTRKGACDNDGSAAWLLPAGVTYDTTRNRDLWWMGGVLEFTLAYSIYDLAYMTLLEPGAAFMLVGNSKKSVCIGWLSIDYLKLPIYDA